MTRLIFLLATAGLFTFLTIPALLVIEPVRWYFGLSWAASVLFFTLFVLNFAGQSLRARSIIGIVVLVFAALNTALAVSFLTQGVAFNTAFFTHLDLSTLRVAWATDGVRLGIAALYIVCAPAVALWCVRIWGSALPTRRLRALAATLTLIIAGATNYPLQAIWLHYLLTRQSSDRMLAEIQSLQVGAPKTTPGTGATRNLVLIYLEGLELNYLDPDLFAGLTPRLTALRDQAIWFSNLEQYHGTGWTMGGIVSSQCGVPLLSEGHGNQILGSVDNPFHQITCLAEILQADGYRTVYLGGATLDFAGKGQFLSDNGYDLTLGIDELPKATRHRWGMFDNDLFGHTTELFDRLAAEDVPFLLTLLTLDTHHPTGTPSPGCPVYGSGDDTMLTAVHCTDRMLADFLDHISNSLAAKNTVVALVSDHLLIHGAPKVRLSEKDRRLTFILIDPSRAPARQSGPATHFDIAPTLLEAVGRADIDLPFGQSLLEHPEGRVFDQNLTDEDFLGFKIESLIAESNLQDGIAFTPADDRVNVGEARFYTRHAQNVHNSTLFARKQPRFLALVFDSLDDRYPRVFVEPDALTDNLRGQENGFVVVASDGQAFCLNNQVCNDGRFLSLYELASQDAVTAANAGDPTTLVISADQVAGLAGRTP